jgi:ATP-dependent DNA helicase DinG
MTSYIDEVFGPGGLFAEAFPGYEARQGQVELSRMVEEAMRDGWPAMGEGPCGTGKGMAYGVPAAWHALHRRKKVLIVTANIALQEQLVTKDLPLLQRILPWLHPVLGRPFSFALLKGRSNYLCHSQLNLRDADINDFAFLKRATPEDEVAVERIREWAKTTETGDVSELPFIPAKHVWSRFAISSDDCKGRGCQFYKEGRCLPARAIEDAANADIVVTNYHLLFAHLAVRSMTGMDLVLPGFHLLVMDEAHEAADIARDFFGFMVTEGSVRKLAAWVKKEGGGNDPDLAEDMMSLAKAFFERVAAYAASDRYRRRLRIGGYASCGSLIDKIDQAARLAEKRMAGGGVKQPGQSAQQTMAELAVPGCYTPPDEHDKKISDDDAEARNALRRARKLAMDISEAVALDDPNKVYWIETDERGPKIKAKVIDVSSQIASELYGEHNESVKESVRIESVVMVSATMTTSSNFEFVRREMGVPDIALEIIAESPFDFERQGLMVVPQALPIPAAPEFPGAVAMVVERVIDDVGGRTLGLFTSYRIMNIVHDHIVRGRHRVLRQGEMPRTDLARVFKSDVASVLLGTESFWTGIDVPGEALTAVVIDKLPFPNMDDPFIDFVCAHDTEAFKNVLIPRAAMLLRQGVGRLIRSQTDIGVVVICDRRLVEKPYRHSFIASLPPMHRSRELGDVRRFLVARGALPEHETGDGASPIESIPPVE